MGVKTLKIYKCDVCGKEAKEWTESWRHKLILHGGAIPYDQEIIVCSSTCAKIVNEMSVSERNKL